jgi:hypothetical protein
VTGLDLGPGLRLSLARQRIRRAVLTIAVLDATPGTPTGGPAVLAAYDELTEAARHLVLAQNEWDDYVEAKRERLAGAR